MGLWISTCSLIQCGVVYTLTVNSTLTGHLVRDTFTMVMPDDSFTVKSASASVYLNVFSLGRSLFLSAVR